MLARSGPPVENTLASVTSWKRIYDNQRATDLRASRDSFFLSAPLLPSSTLVLRWISSSEFRFSNKRPRFTPSLCARSRFFDENTLFSPAVYFPSFFSLSALSSPFPFCSLYACYFLFDFFPCGTCFLLPFVRPLKKTVWQRPSPSRNGFSHVRARTRSRVHVVLAVSNACATSNRSSKSAGRRGLIRERRIGCPDFVVRCALCTHTLMRRATWIRAFKFSSTPCTIKSYVNLPPNIHAVPFGAFLRKFRSTVVISRYSLRRNFYKISFAIVQSNFW